MEFIISFLPIARDIKPAFIINRDTGKASIYALFNFVIEILATPDIFNGVIHHLIAASPHDAAIVRVHKLKNIVPVD